jgi:hypothetical protein
MPSAVRRRDGFGAGEQHRGLMPRRMNRPEHGGVDIAGAVAEKLRRLLLLPRRHRVDVEEERPAGKVRFHRLCRIDAGGRGDGGNDDVGAA